MNAQPRLAGVLPVFQTPYRDDESIDAATLEARDRLALRLRGERHRHGDGFGGSAAGHR